ncbi:hypothetical protein N6H14_28360 [Paenibacillus sp. CC-CFT747]|nr:hypothetical protein N6H14_28360 [Paenibacillus sp. CC-CFT747]
MDYHHGQLRPVVGVQTRQVTRAVRTPGQDGEEGWTYNHAPMLAYWKGSFYLHYLSNPVHEHVPPGRTLLTVSRDGRNWGVRSFCFLVTVWNTSTATRTAKCCPKERTV